MFGWIFTILEGILSIYEWFRGNKDQQIGMEKQQNADLEKTADIQRAELNEAVQPVDSVDSLRNHSF